MANSSGLEATVEHEFASPHFPLSVILSSLILLLQRVYEALKQMNVVFYLAFLVVLSGSVY